LNFIFIIWMVGMKAFFLCILMTAATCGLAEEPYFISYSHHMEEPGNLEVGTKAVVGSPNGGNTFLGNSMEFEYGAKGWWTTEFYLDGQTTANQSTLFTGWRWENRFRPLMREHWINPVLYVEYENLNSANKSLLEVVGHDGRADFLGYNDNGEKEHEAELKLILGSDFKGWNISENFIAEKNLGPEAWEFGYAVGISRPLSLKASPKACVFCSENFSIGAEMYGGLGDWHSFGLKDTSHYLAPLLGMRIPNGPTIKISPGFGLNENSHGALLRFGVTYEIEQIASRLKRH
jgi:hypothetical protein